jgi:hypothetical protein
MGKHALREALGQRRDWPAAERGVGSADTCWLEEPQRDVANENVIHVCLDNWELEI